MTKMTASAYMVIISLLCVIVYLLGVLDANKAVAEKSLWQCENPDKKNINFKTWTILITSSFFIFLGANYTVESVIRLAEILDIGKEIVAVSAVALGTSLPELMVSLSAVRKGNPDLAIGNVLGSNVFNAFAVTGISGIIGPLVIAESILTFGLPVMLIGTVLCFFMIQEREMTQWEGWVFLLFYLFFIGKVLELM